MPENYVFLLVSIKVDYIDITLPRLCNNIYKYIISRRSITPQYIEYNSMSLDVVQSLHFESKQPSSGTYK